MIQSLSHCHNINKKSIPRKKNTKIPQTIVHVTNHDKLKMDGIIARINESPEIKKKHIYTAIQDD